MRWYGIQYGTKHWAKNRFKKYLVNRCPTCGRKPGKLCNTPLTWVHAARIQLVHNQEMIDAAQEEG